MHQRMIRKPKAIRKHIKDCERCQKECDEVFECEICETMICADCQAVYNQFSQIDFNCCKSCEEYNSED